MKLSICGESVANMNDTQMCNEATITGRTHGLTTMKRAIKTLGNRAIDRRSKVGKALEAWRGELIADLGGQDTISAQQQTLIELAVRTKLLVDSIDAWLLQQGSLVNARKRTVYPVVLQRQQLADGLARYLSQLGLERRAKPAKSLAEVLSGSARKGDHPAA